MQNRKPNLFIVGAPKCGTTSLYYYLEQHPAVFMSTPKEINFFSKEDLLNQKLYYQDFKVKDEQVYLQLFEKVIGKKIIGEASVSYLFYPEVANRIKTFNPDSKIIILLRDPVKRAWSHYLMDKRMGLVTKDFRDIFDSQDIEDKLYFQQYFQLGNYYTQIKRYFDEFGQDQIFIGFINELQKDPDNFIYRLFDFLELTPVKIEVSKKFNAFKDANNTLIRKTYANNFLRNFSSSILTTSMKQFIKSKLFTSSPPVLDELMVKNLRNYYLKETEQLEELINKDLSEWKN